MVIISTKVFKNRFLKFQQLMAGFPPVPPWFQNPGTRTRNPPEPMWNRPETPSDLQGTKEPVICKLTRHRN